MMIVMMYRTARNHRSIHSRIIYPEHCHHHHRHRHHVVMYIPWTIQPSLTKYPPRIHCRLQVVSPPTIKRWSNVSRLHRWSVSGPIPLYWVIIHYVPVVWPCNWVGNHRKHNTYHCIPPVYHDVMITIPLHRGPCSDRPIIIRRNDRCRNYDWIINNDDNDWWNLRDIHPVNCYIKNIYWSVVEIVQQLLQLVTSNKQRHHNVYI